MNRVVDGVEWLGAGYKRERIANYRSIVTAQGNIVSTIITTVYSARWGLEISGDDCVKYVTV